MDLQLDKQSLPTSPAFILDENRLVKNLSELRHLKQQSGCKVLYSIKALPLGVVLKMAAEYLDGFSVSSLFEARLAAKFVGSAGGLHITTPGLRVDEIDEIATICSHISFNSMPQFKRMFRQSSPYCSTGIRVNPKLSFASDQRFDPCRLYSKLGVDLQEALEIPESLEGLHFHTVFSNTDYSALLKTITLIKQNFAERLNDIMWINLGGGYLFNQISDHQPLINAIKSLTEQYQLQVFIEPGKALVGNAGYLLTTVIDTFYSDGQYTVVLDTSVNHNPEVFEYQSQPELLEQNEQGEFYCQLVGSSCLAGDVFGLYQLKIKPEVGDRLVFANVGAYSLIKANRFNGYNLPDIYLLDKFNNINLIKQNSYQHYQEQWV